VLREKIRFASAPFLKAEKASRKKWPH
jgi:hypothetical protein